MALNRFVAADRIAPEPEAAVVIATAAPFRFASPATKSTYNAEALTILGTGEAPAESWSKPIKAAEPRATAPTIKVRRLIAA